MTPQPAPDPDLVSLLRGLVAIDSVNPTLVPGGAGETEIARFVGRRLEEAGLDVALEEVSPGRPNVTAVARGKGRGKTLLLNAHLDTVGAGGMERPHEPRIRDGRLYARGAYDMKSGLAAAMSAVMSVSDLSGDVVLTAVADEEGAGTGTKAFVESGVQVDAAIVTEPTDLGVAIAHKGFVGFEVEVHGRAAHGSRPEEGVDAILGMGPVLTALRALDSDLQMGRRHPLLGTESLHASLIEGGQEFSTYPERCLVKGEWRTLPGGADVEARLRDAVAKSDVDASLRVLFRGDAFEVEPDHEIVRLLTKHAGTDLIGLPYWADSATLAGAGIPTVLFGPRGGGAHASDEWVDLPSVATTRDVLVAVATEFCG